MDSIDIMDQIDALLQESSNIVGICAEDMESDVIEESLPANDTIRPNSPTLLVDESTSRFSSAIWAEAIQREKVTLAGLGGIGSYVGLLLSRVRPSMIALYDPDIVDASNMSGQLYKSSMIGRHKVSSLVDIMINYSKYYNIYSHTQRFSFGSPTTNIMICGFDNMSSRKTFYEAWKSRVKNINQEEEKAKCLFIDGRLAAEEFQVFCIKGDDLYHMKKYENDWLFSDGEADGTICSYKQTSHCANMIASVMVNLFVNFVANQCEPLIERDLPFLTSYDASTMYFKTIS